MSTFDDLRTACDERDTLRIQLGDAQEAVSTATYGQQLLGDRLNVLNRRIRHLIDGDGL